MCNQMGLEEHLPFMDLSRCLHSPLGLLSFAFILSSCAGSRDAKLRLRKIVLYQNGIGYFEHTGEAEKDKLQISVRRFELDDALKTLTVVSAKDGGLSPRHGTVHTMTGDGEPKKKGGEQRRVPMDVQIPGGRGERLRVSYSVPTPIWKATYRVIFGGNNRALLQGWAAIQNTSGNDWNDVGLTLATGAPLSFGVNLTRPVYASRPDLTGRMTTPGATGPVRSSRSRLGDRDGDGVPDASDACPNFAEDNDSFEDDDGCPDPDNDHDRILDVDDMCPDDEEVYNGAEDEDGCPDRGRVLVSDSSLQVLDKVYFRAGSDEIAQASLAILDAIVATLIGNPEVSVVEVGGHGASNETAAWILAEGRSVAVVAYLIKAGVNSSRLRIRSYGDSMPIDAKSNEQAYRKNRRVEFLILKRDMGKMDDKSKAPKGPSLVPARSSSGGMVRYHIPATVSIADGESALVPLVNTEVLGEEIYLYRPDHNLPNSDAHPMRAARIVNTGDLALVPGPIAIFGDDAFAGEGLLDSLHPGESAFIPYSLDRSATVDITRTREDRPRSVVSIVEGLMTVVDEHTISTEYKIGSGLTPPKRMFVEHVGEVGYSLMAPPESEFDGKTVLAPVRLRKGKTTLLLRERIDRQRIVSIASASAKQIRGYLAVSPMPDATNEKVERAMELRNEIRLLKGRLEAKRAQRFDDRVRAHEIGESLKALASDKGTLRTNLRRELADSEKRSRRLASDMAALSEGLSKGHVELQGLLATLSWTTSPK